MGDALEKGKGDEDRGSEAVGSVSEGDDIATLIQAVNGLRDEVAGLAQQVDGLSCRMDRIDGHVSRNTRNVNYLDGRVNRVVELFSTAVGSLLTHLRWHKDGGKGHDHAPHAVEVIKRQMGIGG
jgi:hypothetical protein